MNSKESVLQLPEGLGFSMAMNTDAMKNFSNMSEAEKNRVIDKSRSVRSKAEMQKLVDSIAQNKFQG